MRTAVLLCTFAVLAHAQEETKYPGNPDGDGRATINGKISAEVMTRYGKETISGRLSAALKMERANFEKGLVQVSGVNLLFTGVKQSVITGRDGKRPTGTLGFAIAGETQYLKYDTKTNVIEGHLRGTVSASQFGELYLPKEEKGGDYDQPSQEAVISIHIQLTESLTEEAWKEGTEKEPRPLSVAGLLKLEAEVAFNKDLDLSEYVIQVDLQPIVVIEYIWWPMWEGAKRLCIQPVRIAYYTISGWPWQVSIHYSGDGLNFGMPGATTQWRKADVVFEQRAWKTVFNSDYATLLESEETALRNEVDDDDCVEMFFVDKFSPQDNHGGGATWGGGTADTKIISTDENADFGVDLTHLAHELGHAMTLKHPNSGFPTAASPHRVDASTGTLMCGSGFNNDNPTVNSQWNKDSLQNPLFEFTLKVISAGPDCINSGDCGAC